MDLDENLSLNESVSLPQDSHAQAGRSSLKNTRVEYSRVDVTSFIPADNLNDIVVCALCGKSMTIKDYKNDHLAIHNYLSWLEGEEPINLSDEVLVDRILTRVKVYHKKAVFRCEFCNEYKKSAKGYLSHRSICGKTPEEKIKSLKKCEVCGKLLMPNSYELHVGTHLKQQQDQIIITTPKLRPPKPGKFVEEENDLSYNIKDFYSKSSLVTIPTHVRENWKRSEKKKLYLNCANDNCDFKCLKIKAMRAHFRTCGTNAQVFYCNGCDFTCLNENEMATHVDEIHFNKSTQNVNLQEKFYDNQGLVHLPFLSTFSTEATLATTQKNLESLYSQDILYTSYMPNDADWSNLLSVNDHIQYLPSTSVSAKFTFNGTSWNQLNKFETRSIRGEIVVGFVGGPIVDFKWAPGEGQQFLALSCQNSMDVICQAGSACSAPGHIQLWSLGFENNKDDLQKLNLEYILCHDGGECRSIEWCPSGCRNENRLGLLALGTTSGKILIYALPQPKNLSNKLYKPKPILSLEISIPLSCCITKLSWSKVSPHGIISAGFVNGMIAIWDITLETPLLKKDNSLQPFKVFQAHNDSICALCLSPANSNLLISCSNDKSIKFWDTDDTTVSLLEYKKGPVTDIDWSLNLMMCLASLDTTLLKLKTAMVFISVRDLVYEPIVVADTIQSIPLGISNSDWLSSVALSYDNGHVCILKIKKQPSPNDEMHRSFKTIIDPIVYDLSQNPPKLYSETNLVSNNYNDAVANFGIFFELGDSDTIKERPVKPPNLLDIYPLVSANKISWNPNNSSYNNLAIGYQSGFLIIQNQFNY